MWRWEIVECKLSWAEGELLANSLRAGSDLKERYKVNYKCWLSSRNFFQGGEGKFTVMQTSFVIQIFLLFSDQILGGKCL